MKAYPYPPFNTRNSREYAEDWRGLQRHTPFLSLDAGWTIAVIPPFADAAARFLIKNEAGHQVSVYLDTASVLGAEDNIYWEVMPGGDGEPDRCDLEDAPRLLEIIREGLACRAKDTA